MNEQSYYYGEPGGETRGPLELSAITAAFVAGRLSKDVVLSPDGREPWTELRFVNSKALAESGKTSSPAKQEAPPKSVAGFFEVIGAFLAVLGVFCAAAMFFQQGPRIMFFALAAISNFVSGLFLLGFSEVLRRLSQILAALRK